MVDGRNIGWGTGGEKQGCVFWRTGENVALGKRYRPNNYKYRQVDRTDHYAESTQ